MPGQSGIEVHADAAQGGAASAKVLVLSMQDDPRYVREAFAAGARGYVLKEAADTEVVAAVREVAGGGRYVHPELGARLVAAERRRAPRRGGSAHRPRARGAAPARARPHEPGDREAALHLGAHGRDAPRAHHAEAPARRPAPSSSATRSRTACSTPSLDRSAALPGEHLVGDRRRPRERRPRAERRAEHRVVDELLDTHSTSVPSKTKHDDTVAEMDAVPLERIARRAGTEVPPRSARRALSSVPGAEPAVTIETFHDARRSSCDRR